MNLTKFSASTAILASATAKMRLCSLTIQPSWMLYVPHRRKALSRPPVTPLFVLQEVHYRLTHQAIPAFRKALELAKRNRKAGAVTLAPLLRSGGQQREKALQVLAGWRVSRHASGPHGCCVVRRNYSIWMCAWRRGT